MAYSLKRLLRARGVRRKSITLTPQFVPIYAELALSQATLAPVRFWEGEIKRLLEVYEGALGQMTRDSAEGDLRTVLLSIDERAQTVTLSAEAMVSQWLADFSTRHARTFANRVKSRTRIDPWPYIDLQANADDIAFHLREITSLITNINDQARKDVAQIVWRSVIDRVPARRVGKEIAEKLKIARNRANFIASDQANKVNAHLTEIRQEEAGFSKFIWETAKDMRVRPEHAALQGRIFEWKKPPAVGLPGTPPRCRCTGAAYLDLDDDDE